MNYCRKCLLKDMPENVYFKNLYDYIETLSEDIKANAAEYERRLNICKECDNLLNGMCRICGCFIELRAVIDKNYCPDIDKKW
ncbi:hypothetical protein Ana3638_04470 [Anaerocolumna sedimenticola]|uniref:Uncharacterized protein n=2 Tax=Anaerocolumna sedimenticola TaxID=2696063 RepID=A0A6P1TQT4_9FIRM|nr:hypothetical protein Ana3638_04470 [Anaerocolumna sedimenticola]